MPNIAQRTLSRGEIDPKLNSRVDLAAYFSSLSTCRNAYVPRNGGIISRAGTEWVGETKYPSKVIRSIPFIFSAADSYVLEFGDLTMRVIRDGAYVTETAVNIATITSGTQAQITATAHGYSDGDEVYISSVGGMTELNGLVYVVASAATNTFKIEYKQSLSFVNTTGFHSYTSGGTVARLYTLSTPYAEADLDDLIYDQSYDTIIITHRTYPPKKLVRSGHASWAISTIKTHRYEAPRTCAGTAGVSGGKTYKYKITDIFAADGTESLPGTATSYTIASISKANPAVVTITAHPYSNGDEIRIAGCTGMTEVNERQFIVASAATNSFSLLNTDSTSYTAFSAGGVAAVTHIKITSADTPTVTSPNVLSWTLPQYLTLTSVTQANLFSIYRESGGIYSLIGTTSDTTFNDTNLIANAAYSPTVYNELFLFANDYPGVCAFYQQCLLLGSTNNHPRTFWKSVIGDIYNFTVHFPLEEDDPAEFTLAHNGITAIRNLADLRRLLIFTDATEEAANGDASGALTVTQPNIRPYSYWGSTTLKPIIVNDSALYVQREGGIIRDMTFNFSTDGYTGSDLTIWNAHLLDGFTIVDWAYQKIPHSVIWIVRDDGVLLSMTYIKEQQILGLARHDTDGTVENVCAIPEDNETSLYLCVKRMINSGTHRYQERMKTRHIADATDIRDYIGMDCSETYDGRNTDTTRTMTLTGSSYTATSSVTCTSNFSIFDSTYVGKYVFLHGLDSSGDAALVRGLITTVTSGTVCVVTPDITVPTPMQAVAITEWGIGVTSVRNLWHLEAESLMVMGDGWERANPNMSNSTYAAVTVASSVATLSSPHEVIHFGLPFVSDIGTLDIDNPQGQSLMSQNKIVTHITVYTHDAREFWSGPEFPDDASQTGMKPSRPTRPSGTYLDAPPELLSEPITLQLKGEWGQGGRVAIRNLSCYPLEVIAINPNFHVGK